MTQTKMQRDEIMQILQQQAEEEKRRREQQEKLEAEQKRWIFEKGAKFGSERFLI